MKKTYLKRKPGNGLKRSKLASTASKPRKMGKGTVSKLKKKLDAIFSLYIRTRDEGQCYTCPKKDEIKKMQNGHFIPRQYLAVRWDEMNNHCQCYACNMLYNGQPGAYATRLERDYGKGTVELLESKRKLVVKMKPEDYEYWITIFAEKLEALKLSTPQS